jgi:hypothetical protein
MRMILGSLALAVMLPGAGMAQTDYIVCRTALEALAGIANRLGQISEAEADLHDDLLEIADSIDGFESANLKLKANRHHTATNARLETTLEIMMQARDDILAVCPVE